jgi:hypothetical protein
MFTTAAKALDGLRIAFLEMRASRPESTFRPAIRQLVPAIRQAFKGTLNAPNSKTFYTPRPAGYIDYPTLTFAAPVRGGAYP